MRIGDDDVESLSPHSFNEDVPYVIVPEGAAYHEAQPRLVPPLLEQAEQGLEGLIDNGRFSQGVDGDATRDILLCTDKPDRTALPTPIQTTMQLVEPNGQALRRLALVVSDIPTRP